MELIDVVLILVGFSLLESISKKKNKEKMTGGGSSKATENIYNETLVSCKEGTMSNGSWDGEGKCSELGGGVHQICIKNISKNTPSFSKSTGQSNWSDQRGRDNHCVCLGAWSLYNAKGKNNNKKKLKCDAIPKDSLSINYVNKFSNSQGWNVWNGLELENQIVDGVEALIEECYDKNSNSVKHENLKNNYCNLSNQVNALRNRPKYNEICIQ